MIDIVIVNWNAGAQLSDCINSIQMHAKGLAAKATVVDNGSVDHSPLFLAAHPDVTLINAGSNLGFGKACNLGANLGCGEYILFLNPDAALNEDSLTKALTFMCAPNNARVGICGVQLRDESGRVARSCSRFPTPFRMMTQATGADRLWPRLGARMAEWAHDQTRDVDQVIGAFFLVRRRVFEEIGGFDERFFVYFEEVDFALRARQAGWRSVYLAEVQAFHAGGGTSNQVKARRLFYSLRSRLLYAFKHFGWPSALLVAIATLLMEPFARTAFAILRRSWPSLRETWSGFGMLWRWLPLWVFKGVPS